MAEKPLQAEIEYFERMRSEWLQHHSGQFALVHDRKLMGTYTTFEEAYSEGVKRLGNVPMLIKQVLPTDPVHHAPALTHGLIRTNA